MAEILHTNSCSKKHSEAEKLSKINLNPDRNCPRCRLNLAAPALRTACEVAVLALTHRPINPKDIDFIKQAIAKTE